MNYCGSCGAALAPGPSYCTSCGSPIPSADSPKTATSAPAVSAATEAPFATPTAPPGQAPPSASHAETPTEVAAAPTPGWAQPLHRQQARQDPDGEDGRGRWRSPTILALVLAVLLAGGVGAWVVISDDQPATPQAADAASDAAAAIETAVGPVTLRYTAETFPTGVEPEVRLESAADDFVSTFALPGTVSVVADITSPTQPTTPVEVAFDYDAAALPVDAVPSIFYLDAERGLWLPIPTVADAATGRLVGTTDHFTSFVAALTTAIDGVEKGAQWLRYQTASLTGSRADGPDCLGGIPPRWVVREDTDLGLNDPLPSCITTNDDGDLELHVVVNRGYSLALSGPTVPTAVEYRSFAGTSEVLYQTTSRQMEVVGAEEVFLPARVETVLTYPQSSVPPGRVELLGRPTPATAGLDVVVAAGEILIGAYPHAVTELVNMIDCASKLITAPSGDAVRAAGSAVETVQSCTDLALRSLDATDGAAARRIKLGIDAVWAAGRGGQAAVDATMAWQEPADVVLQVQAPGPGVPPGAVLLSDLLLGSGGDGPSGSSIDVTLGNVDVPMSTSQWVGCEGTAAWGEYALEGHTRLTALLGLRDFTPLELVVGVRIMVDGVLVQEFTVDGPAIGVDVALPPGEVLRLEAQRLSGTCTSAPEGYGAWGNAALS